jgi:hypothetical protein
MGVNGLNGGSVSVGDVLEVISEFEALEPAGVSSGLVAWELRRSEGTVHALIEAAQQEELIALSGWDDRQGEQLWKLTLAGRDHLESRTRSGREHG